MNPPKFPYLMVYFNFFLLWSSLAGSLFSSLFKMTLSKLYPASSIQTTRLMGQFPTPWLCCPWESIWAPAATRQATSAIAFNILFPKAWVKHQSLLPSSSLKGPCHLTLPSCIRSWKTLLKKFFFLSTSALTPSSVEDGWLHMPPEVDSYYTRMSYICALAAHFRIWRYFAVIYFVSGLWRHKILVFVAKIETECYLMIITTLKVMANAPVFRDKLKFKWQEMRFQHKWVWL